MPITRHNLVAWAAGFIDGEGCIGIYTINQGRNFRLSLSAGQKNNDAPLFRLVSLFGGGLTYPKSENSSHATAYWCITSQRAADALEEMMPYLTVKKKQARLALKFQARRLPRTQRNHWSSEVVRERHNQRDQRDYALMRSLKGGE